MPYPKSRYPYQIWDGLTHNPSRLSTNSNLDPNANDWERIASEVISLQKNSGALLLPTAFKSCSLTVTDSTGKVHPLRTSANLLANAEGGAFTVTLPPAAEFGQRFIRIKKVDVAGNDITISPNGDETIDGLLTFVLKEHNEFVAVVSDGSDWHVIGQGGSYPEPLRADFSNRIDFTNVDAISLDYAELNFVQIPTVTTFITDALGNTSQAFPKVDYTPSLNRVIISFGGEFNSGFVILS